MSKKLQPLVTDEGEGRLLLEPPLPIRYRFQIGRWMIEGTPGTFNIGGTIWPDREGLIQAFASNKATELELAGGEIIRVNVSRYNPGDPLGPVEVSHASGGDVLLKKHGLL